MAALPVPCTTPAAATNEEMAVVTSGLTQGGGQRSGTVGLWQLLGWCMAQGAERALQPPVPPL
jgi:hypothetical protein